MAPTRDGLLVVKNNDIKPKRRRWLRRLSLTVGVATLISLGVAWMIFQHKPDWYHPAHVDDLTLETAQHSFTTFVDDTSHKMVKGTPFDIVLNQQQINIWLAAMPALFPQARKELPDWLSESAVSVSSDMLRVGVRYDKNGWRAILNAGVQLSVSQDGASIMLALREAHGGSIPIPHSTLKKILSGMIDHQNDKKSSILSQTQSVDEVFTGLNIDNNFLWPNGRRPYRIESMSFHDGKIKLRIDPQRR